VLWVIGLAVYRTRPAWIEAIVNLLILLVAFVNNLVHAGDGWTAIMPWGLGLSLVTVVLLVVSGTLRRLALHPSLRA
ncbi:MAG TPA: DUF2231 domain-containing protein, partial [Tabrizicola sp.]